MVTERTLTLGPKLTLPLEVVTRTTGIVGQRGTGKTSTAVVVVEEADAAGAQVVVIDPTGAWYGLRSSADGTGAGLDVIVLGGHNGDLPLDPEAGAVVARLLVEQRLSVVLDLELMTKGQQVRFVAEFCEQLYHLNRTALLLVIDEAHRFAPQSLRDPGGYGARCLGAVTDVVTLGRRKGLGAVLISQRLAKIAKDVLEQAEVLIAHRLMGPNDRKALAGWMEEAAADVEGAPGMDELPRLERGAALVWAPTLDVFGRYKIRPKSTFDSSATPEVGGSAVIPEGRAPVDLAALRATMAEAVERVEQDSPEVLRRRIRALEAELDEGRMEDTILDGDALEEARDALADAQQEIAQLKAATVGDGERAALRVEYLNTVERLNAAERVIEETSGQLDRLGLALEAVGTELGEDTGSRTRTVSQAPPPREDRNGGEAAAPAPKRTPARDVQGLGPGAARVLGVLATRHPLRFTRSQVAALARYKASGGAYAGALKELRDADYLTEEGGEFGVSKAGLKASGVKAPEPPRTAAAALRMWLDVLDPPEARVLETIHGLGGKVSRDRLAGALGMTASGGAYAQRLAVLRRNGLIASNGRGQITLAPRATAVAS